MAKITLAFFLIVILILIVNSDSPADIPRLINFQGKLYDNEGNPMTGRYEITFRIYDVEEEGTALWTETDSVRCDEGLYSIILGLTTQIDLDFDGQYWLEVHVTGDDPLSPRSRLVSVPMAFRARVADQVSWTNLTDVPEGFADGKDDAAGVGGVSQINGGTAVDVTNPTGPTTTVSHAEDASELPHAHHTKTTSATELTSGTLDNDRFSAYGDLDAEGKIGTGPDQIAEGHHEHDDRYFTENELQTNDGTVNQVQDPVSWSKIKDIPAGFADGIDNSTGGGSGGGWVDDGTIVRLETDSDKVGIGATSPNGQLHVRSTSTAVVNIGGNGNGDIARLGLFEDSDAGEETGILLNYSGSKNELDFVEYSVGTEGNELLTIQRDGNVGVGTNDPGTKLHVRYSNSGHTPSNVAGLFVENGGSSSSSYVLQTATAGGGKSFSITNTGKVGIGTVSPNGKLHVVGSISVGDDGANASGAFSTALGHSAVASGNYSTAIGYRANAAKDGSIAIADNSTSNYLNTNWPDTFFARFIRGFYFYTSTDLSTGAILGNGDSSWASVSDSTKKENFKIADGEAFLNKIRKFKLGSWNYIGQEPQKFRHYGPMAQDFYSAFGNDGIGTIGTDTTIASADFDGVVLIAIQALDKRTRELSLANRELQKQNDDLRSAIEQLKTDIIQLTREMKLMKNENAEMKCLHVRNGTVTLKENR